MWDPTQYERFRGERMRPFFDLLSRIPDRSYKSIVDLGCGSGDLTVALAEHWPEARVIGLDSSEEMLAAAEGKADPGRLDFVRGDIETWKPAQPVELVVANAAFQWVADHDALLSRMAAALPSKGVLAVQMPANFDSPSHRLLKEAVAGKVPLRYDVVLPIARYVEILQGLGLLVDAWETVYQHVLPGKDAVLEWTKGTALRPVLKALQGAELDSVVHDYAAKLRAAYPEMPAGTLFPFRRLFFVAGKR